MGRVNTLEKTLMVGNIESRNRRMTEEEMVGWHQQPDGMSLSKLREMVMDREAWRTEVHSVTGSQTRLSNLTEQNKTASIFELRS